MAECNTSNTDKCKRCSVCGQELLAYLVFTNAKCGHDLCRYCLEESNQLKTGLCILRRCPAPIDPAQLKEFYNSAEHGEETEKAGLKSVNQSHRVDPLKNVTCTVCCQQTSNQNLAFINDSCNHAVCTKCIAKNRPVFDGECFMKDCGRPMNFIKYSDFISETAGLSGFDVMCSKCATELSSNRVYVNSECNHVLCNKCTGKLTSTWCPVSRCRKHVDEEKVMIFSMNLIAREQSSHSSQMEPAKPQERKQEEALEIKCGICRDIMHNCVTTHPCLHNFCAACFSTSIQASKSCKVCQGGIKSVHKNHAMRRLIDQHLRQYPEKRKPQDVYTAMDQQDIVNKDMVEFK